jgi:polysaccharide biosynthesis/export protein
MIQECGFGDVPPGMLGCRRVMGHRGWTTIGAAFLLAALLGGCTSGASTSSDAAFAKRADSLPQPKAVAALYNAEQTEARVGPLDLIEVSVFQVPDLSKTVKVSASGEVALPLIGTVQAGGKTVSELEAEIAARLEEKYLQSAQVSVFIREATSQQVTVDGAVEKPGIMPLSGQTTLLQTIAMSGGLAKGADPRGILVFRTVDQKRMAAKFDLVAIRAGTAEDPVLYGGDVVVVDSSGIRSALGSVRENIPVFGLFSALML